MIKRQQMAGCVIRQTIKSGEDCGKHASSKWTTTKHTYLTPLGQLGNGKSSAGRFFSVFVFFLRESRDLDFHMVSHSV